MKHVYPSVLLTYTNKKSNQNDTHFAFPFPPASGLTPISRINNQNEHVEPHETGCACEGLY